MDAGGRNLSCSPLSLYIGGFRRGSWFLVLSDFRHPLGLCYGYVPSP